MEKCQTLSMLVVEDDTSIQELLKTAFEESSYRVVTADDGEQAQEILKNDNTFDVVITDILMPKKEGVSLIRFIRNHFRDVKIIAISAVTEYETVLKTAMEFGADLTFKKPFDINKMVDNVNKLTAEIEQKVV